MKNRETTSNPQDRRASRRHRWSAAGALVMVAAAVSPACVAPEQRRGAVNAGEITEQNKGVVREFFRVFSTGNVANILALLRDDATYWVSGSVQGFSGVKTKAQLAQVIAGVGDLYVGGSLSLTPSML